MKKRLQGLIAGLLIGATLTGGAAFATSGTKSINVLYDNIKVYKDNVLCELKDSDGIVVEPFIYNGTTYLPVRGTANLAGMQVTWDGATKSVYLWEDISPEGTLFIEECQPYDTSVCTSYLASNGKHFTMAGESYSNGIAFGNKGGGHALFNLNGKYSAIECVIGHTDSEDDEKLVSFIVDGKVVMDVKLEPECLPKKVLIPLDYGLQLKIQAASGNPTGWCIGIGNMTVK